MTAKLPGVLGEIASVVGVPAALAIAERVGGTRVYIPSHVGDDHWLVEAVGREAAVKICELFAVDGSRGQRVDMPVAAIGGRAYRAFRQQLARRVHKLDKEGKSARQIALEVGLTERGVRRHRAAHRGGSGRKDDPQGSLF
jgi:hypothetical protein